MWRTGNKAMVAFFVGCSGNRSGIVGRVPE